MKHQRLSEREILFKLFPEILSLMYKKKYFPKIKRPRVSIVEIEDRDGYHYEVTFNLRVFFAMNNQDYQEISNIIKAYNHSYKNAYTKSIFKRTDRYYSFTVTCDKMSKVFLDQFLEMMNRFPL